MLRRPPISTLFPTRRSSDLRQSTTCAVGSCSASTARSGNRREAAPPFSAGCRGRCPAHRIPRSEEHTSELQSRENLVCRLLLEKKKQNRNRTLSYHKGNCNT